jgi:hypothetical protein
MSVDQKVAAVLDKSRADDSDEDDLFEELENDDSMLDNLRAQRMQQLHEEYVPLYPTSKRSGQCARLTEDSMADFPVLST